MLNLFIIIVAIVLSVIIAKGLLPIIAEDFKRSRVLFAMSSYIFIVLEAIPLTIIIATIASLDQTSIKRLQVQCVKVVSVTNHFGQY